MGNNQFKNNLLNGLDMFATGIPNKRTLNCVEIHIAGAHKTGKSSLLQSITGKVNLKKYTRTRITNSTIYNWVHPQLNKVIQLRLWDIVPTSYINTKNIQKEFQTFTNSRTSRITNLDGIILMYNPKIRSTFEYIIRMIDTIPEDVEILVIANFKDCVAKKDEEKSNSSTNSNSSSGMKKKERNVPFEEAQRFAQDCKIQKNLSVTVIEMSVANKYGYHQLNNWVRFVYLKFQKDSRKRINENYIKLSSNLRFILKQKKTMKKKANTSGQPQKSTNTNTNTYTNTNINTKTNTNTNENVMDNSKMIIFFNTYTTIWETYLHLKDLAKPFNQDKSQDKSNRNLNVNKKPIPRSKSQEFKPRNYTEIQSFNPKGFIESFNAINSVNNNYIFDHTQDNSLDIGNTNSNMLTNEIWDLDTNVEVENVGSIKNKEQINIEKRYEKNQEKEYKNELGQEQVQKPEQAEVQKQEQAEVYKKGQEWEHDQEYGEDRIENKDKYQGNLENNKINNLMDENENEKNYNDRKKKKVKNIIGFFDDDELEESEESEESVKNEENEENKEINENEKSVESVENEKNEKNEENNENKKEESVKNEENEENKEINENNKTPTQKSENKSKENINKKEENLLNNKNNDFGITPFQNDGDENGFGYY